VVKDTAQFLPGEISTLPLLRPDSELAWGAWKHWGRPMSNVKPELVDQATEQYRQLIRQNNDFAVRMSAALKSGAETAAGMTATVRTKSDTRRSLVANSDSTQVAS
jgi:hypothetical protein